METRLLVAVEALNMETAPTTLVKAEDREVEAAPSHPQPMQELEVLEHLAKGLQGALVFTSSARMHRAEAAAELAELGVMQHQLLAAHPEQGRFGRTE
jgi:hypothetical protein